MNEFRDINKLKKEKVFSIRKILNKKDLDEFELDMVMNDLI
jgi:hypothetical protein